MNLIFQKNRSIIDSVFGNHLLYITTELTFHEGNKNFIGLVLGNNLHN